MKTIIKNFFKKNETKKQLIKRLWKIRREETFEDWDKVKKELGITSS